MPSDGLQPHGDPPAASTISADAAASALCEYFLANAERDDHAANDHLVAEMANRTRARQHPVDPALADGDRRG